MLIKHHYMYIYTYLLSIFIINTLTNIIFKIIPIAAALILFTFYNIVINQHLHTQYLKTATRTYYYNILFFQS